MVMVETDEMGCVLVVELEVVEIDELDIADEIDEVVLDDDARLLEVVEMVEIE